MVFVVVALGCGVVLSTSRVLHRQELQTINKRFEARQWLVWSPESLRRLNPSSLWQYHEAHEIPRRWWAWDYTLSWLLANNHPQVKHKVIIFNHLLEDEPPAEAVREHPWMKPLLNHPIPRACVADMVTFLARSGVRLIILDNDFPQYTSDDGTLARAIHEAARGGFGKPVPVLMARTVNRRSSGNVLELEVPSMPTGVIEKLEKIEPGSDVVSNYTGITGTMPDEDQVVRRIALRLPGLTGPGHDSIVLKAIQALGEPVAKNAPDVMDIDFSGPPNSELYPVRPLSYLLDPERRLAIAGANAGSGDVTLKDAVVVLGDGVIDVFSTPFTNSGVNQMSGSEILVQAMETLSRERWPERLSETDELLYIAALSLAGGLIWIAWKSLQQKTMSSFRKPRMSRLLRSLTDLWCIILMLSGAYGFACLVFAYYNLIVPVFVPSIALAMGTVAALLWEREREREETFRVKLETAEEKLVLAQDRYEADLKRGEAEAKAREILLDRQRRHEFVRRINHDLNAPVSVLNWTLAELQEEGVDGDTAREKLSRLVKGSDKLCELIDQLVQSYDYENQPEGAPMEVTDLSKVLADSLDMQRPLAEMNESEIAWTLPADSLWVRANSLELSRVIDNIVRNAIKHNPAGTQVTVSVKTGAGDYEIDIADNGRGIAPDHLKHVFEPGYRVDPTRKDSQGLGLDIVKTLVERMGGRIAVASAVGKGTTFTIKIPACPPDQAVQENGHGGSHNNGGS